MDADELQKADRLPSTQVKDAINATQVGLAETVQVEQWERDLDRFSYQDHWDLLDERINSAHLKYAKFVARRHYLSRHLDPADFQQMASTVTQRLVYYDPNFDFSSGAQSLSRQSNYMPSQTCFSGSCNECVPSF